MSAGNVSRIIVSNHGSFDASMWVIVGPGAALALNPTVEAGDINISLDLTTVRGLNNGDQFTVRAVSGQGVQANNTTILTYTRNSNDAGRYSVTGIAVAPGISFQGIHPI
ncbi:hypothetical protein GYMLUDRAFT_248388 [Collybiopsis luxurians FD-317 M1]|uniref:Uncharacterized protein n=1 Tax=Collybiopsis luxurians FD-317 M1 TaxID=944289 RepID=A0A0D0AYM2_9AGAR|nr:hypothetical protein GYMLUDRAFT_248388 [Collybiopsis luxurians FD-317 M1]